MCLFVLICSIKNRVYASINSIDSAATPSYPVSNLFQSFCFVAIKLLMFHGSIDLTTMDLHVCALSEAQQVKM